MTERPLAEPPSAQLRMDQQQFASLITTVAAALRQSTAPLSTDQQTVALQFRLIRNGLGRFKSASEAFDRALIRIDQLQYDGGSALVFHDPIPASACSMVLVYRSHREPRELPGRTDNGACWHRADEDPETKVVQLVEFLDEFSVPVAAGVPIQVQDDSGDWCSAYSIPRQQRPGRSKDSQAQNTGQRS